VVDRDSRDGRTIRLTEMRFMRSGTKTSINDTLESVARLRRPARKPEGQERGGRVARCFSTTGRKIICSGQRRALRLLIEAGSVMDQRRTQLGMRWPGTEEEGTGKGSGAGRSIACIRRAAMQVQKPDHVIGKHNKILRYYCA